MFFRFRGVRELRFQAGETVTVLVTNMTPEFWRILRLLGMEYEKYYWRKRTCEMWDKILKDEKKEQERGTAGNVLVFGILVRGEKFLVGVVYDVQI